MRLTSMLIERYGSFEQTRLAFDPRPGCVNLVVAPNGAGKSVLRQAFHDLLFGIPLQSDMRFRFDYAGMHLHAEAVTQDGTPLAFGWRRKPGRTFGPGATERESSAHLSQLLAAVSPRQLEHLFALDTARLRRGGEELADGGDTLGVALLSGTGELAPARKLRQTLLARDGRTELVKAKRALTAAGKAVRDAVQQPRQRETQAAALAEQRKLCADAEAAHQAARETSTRLARIDRTRQALTDRQTALAWLAENPDAPFLPPGLEERLANVRAALSIAQAQHTEARRGLAAAEAQTPPDLDQDALDEIPRLTQIAEAIEVRRKEAEDVAGLRMQLQEQHSAIERLLQQIGVTDRDGAGAPSAAVQATSRTLIKQYAVLQAALAKTQARLLTAEQAMEEDAPEDSAPDPAVVEAVHAIVRQARARQDPTVQAEDAARAMQAKEAAETAAVARVPGWQGDINGLRAATPLTDAAFDRLDDAHSRAAAALQTAAERRAALQAQRAAWEQALGALREQTLPDAATLAESRAARDQGWRLIHRRAFGAEPPDLAAEQAYAGEEPLALVFERHLRAADALADQRITELSRVQEAERLVQELARSEPAWRGAQAEEATARAALTAAEQDWAAACAPLRLQPSATRREVEGFAAAREKAIAAAEAAQIARAEHADILRGQAVLAAQLAVPLAAGSDQGLAALLTRADMLLERAQAAEKIAIARRATRAGLEKALRLARRDMETAQRDVGAWQDQWDASLQALARPPGEMPAATEAVLERLSTLALHDQEASSLTTRIAAIGENIGLFTGAVQALAGRLGMAQEDVFATAAALVRRRDAAVTNQATWLQAQKDLAQRRQGLRIAEAAEVEAQQALASVVAACGAADDAEAERRIADAQARRHAETLRDTAEAALRQQGDGLPVAALQAEADALPPEQMAAARSAADAALNTALVASTQAAVELSRQQAQFDQDAATTQAADAADAQAQAAATFGRLLDEALVVRLAASLLAKGIQQIEQAAGHTGLHRIATAFSAVTNDAYTIEGIEDEQGETALRAVERRFPNERKRVGRPKERSDGQERRAELSDGTRDQLYLALRLVALEDHAAAAPAPPFIADDILQTFDDDRALAAFGALLRLSEHVQVIVLTHHQHLVELAQRLPAGSVHCQAL